MSPIWVPVSFIWEMIGIGKWNFVPYSIVESFDSFASICSSLKSLHLKYLQLNPYQLLDSRLQEGFAQLTTRSLCFGRFEVDQTNRV